MFSSIFAKERLSRRHALHIEAKQAVCTYIPKNACSTLRFSVAIANGMPRNDATQAYIHTRMPAMVASRQELAHSTYAFVILRCPFRRIASAFLDKAAVEDSRARALFPRHRSLLDSSAKKRTATADLQAKVMALTFSDFLEQLRTCPSHLIDPHFRPQTDFLIKQGYSQYFAVESMPLAEATLREKLGFQLIDLSHHAIGKLAKTSVDASNLTISELIDIKASGHAPHYTSLFTSATRRVVETFYAADIALYKRQFGSEALLFADT